MRLSIKAFCNLSASFLVFGQSLTHIFGANRSLFVSMFAAVLALGLCPTIANAQSGITLTKATLPASATLVAGQSVTYQITATNNSGGTLTNAMVSDTLAAQFFVPSISVTQVSNTAGATGISSSAAGTNPAKLTIGTFGNNEQVIFNVTATLNSNASGSVTNTVTASTAGSSATINNTLPTPTPPTVTVSKTADITTLAPGVPITYTIKVKNTSTTTDAIGYTIYDRAGLSASPSGSNASTVFNLTNGTSGTALPCILISGSPCPTVTATLAATVLLNSSYAQQIFSTPALVIPKNTEWSFTYKLALPASPALMGCGYTQLSLYNTAYVQTSTTTANSATIINGTWTPPPGPACIVNPPPTPVDIGVTKTGVRTTVAGVPAMTYTMTVTNYSNVALSNGEVYIDDYVTLSGTGLTGPLSTVGNSYSCSPSGGAVCPAAPMIAQALFVGPNNGLFGKSIPTFPAGSSLTLMLTLPINLDATCGATSVAVKNKFSARVFGGVYTLGAVSPHVGAATTPDETFTTQARACVDIVASKNLVQSTNSFGPGQPIAFTIKLDNAGSTAATNVPFEDQLPPGFVYVSSTCAPTGAASCGGSPTFTAGSPDKVNLSVASLGANGSGSVLITINGSTTTNATLFGAKTNAVIIPSQAGSYVDLNTVNNATSQNFFIRGRADLSVTKTSAAGCGVAHTAGGAATYIVTVTNNGPDVAIGGIVKDPAVANLSITGLSCSPGSGAVCPTGTAAAQIAALQSVPGLVIPSLANGATATFTLTGTYGASAASVSNAATVSLPGTAYDLEANTTNNNATCDSATVVAPLIITKTIAGSSAGTQGAVVVSVNCGGVVRGPFTLAAGSAAGTYTLANITGIPVGVSCVATETSTGVVLGSTVSTTYTTSASGGTIGSGTSATVVVAESAVPSSIAFTDTYPASEGSFAVTKTIAGAAAGSQGAVTINVNCGGTLYGPYTVAAGATGLTNVATINNIPSGVVCKATETANGSSANLSAATTVSVNNGAAVPSTMGSATIVNAQTRNVAFVNSYTNIPGSLTITKAFAGNATGQQGPLQFSVKCGSTNFGPYTIPANATTAQTVTSLSGVPGGASCVVTEATTTLPTNITTSTTASVNGSPPITTMTAGANIVGGATQQVAFVNTYDTSFGNLEIYKSVNGATGTGLASLNFSVVCSGTTYGPFTTAAGIGSAGTTPVAVTFINNIPTGSICAVSETNNGAASGQTVTTTYAVNAAAPSTGTVANAVAITANQTTRVDFVNTLTTADTTVTGAVSTSCGIADGALAAATVTFAPSSGGSPYSTTTGPTGNFAISLPAGTYTMTVTPSVAGVAPSVQTVVIPPGTAYITAQVTVTACAIPTISEWNMGVLSALLFLIACAGLRLRLRGQQ